jgi:hypothetical protein
MGPTTANSDGNQASSTMIGARLASIINNPDSIGRSLYAPGGFWGRMNGSLDAAKGGKGALAWDR